MSTPPSSKPTVLIVEDEWLIADLLQHWLEEAGYQVVGPAGSVKEAREILATFNIHAAVLDINLGAESSLPLAQDLIGEGMPVVLTTGYSGNDLPNEFRACRTLVKPVLRHALIETLSNIVLATE